MSDMEAVSIDIPRTMLEDIKMCAEAEKISDGEVIKRAIDEYIQARKGQYIRESLRAGYERMASLNLSIARNWFRTESEDYQLLLEGLSGGGDIADN